MTVVVQHAHAEEDASSLFGARFESIVAQRVSPFLGERGFYDDGSAIPVLSFKTADDAQQLQSQAAQDGERMRACMRVCLCVSEWVCHCQLTTVSYHVS